MSNFFTNRRLVILLSSVIVFVGLIGFSLKDRASITTGESFIKDSVGYIQSIASAPVYWVQGFYDSIQNYKNLYEENAYLKSKLENYVSDQILLEELERENELLSQIVEAKEKMRDKTIFHATVIARNPDQWDQVLFINKGESDGVSVDMAVMTPNGLIGKISQVSEYTAKVQLITGGDRTNRISAMLQGKKLLYGIIEGDVTDEGNLLLKRIPIDGTIKEGMTVITSGLGGVFPKGLNIGKVVTAYKDEHGLTQTVVVKPAVDFYQIEEVMVVERQVSGSEDLLQNTVGEGS